MKKINYILLFLVFTLSTAPLFGEESLNNKLIGAWETKPHISQLGTITEGFTFTKSGSCTATVKFIDANIPTMTESGIYKIDGNILKIKRGNEIFSHTFNFENDMLIIKESNGDSYQLLKK